MSESKTFVFPDSGNNNGMLGLLAPMLQKNGLDPNMVFAMMNNRGNGFGSEGGWFMWVIFLFFLMGWGGNGFGGFGGNRCVGGLENFINNDAGRELFTSLLQGNREAIGQLATTLNCDVNAIQSALNALQTQLCGIGNQIGMSGQQIINAIQAGDCNIAQQIASCCCDLKSAIINQGYENRIATITQTNELKSDSNTHFNILGAKIDAQTQIIQAGFCDLEKREMQREIQALRDERNAYQLSASQQQQTQNIVNQIRPCPVPAYITCNPFGCNGGVEGYPWGYPGNGCGC